MFDDDDDDDDDDDADSRRKGENTCSLFPLKFISNNLCVIIYAISICDILQVKTFLQKH